MPLLISILIVGSVEYTFWRGYAKTPIILHTPSPKNNPELVVSIALAGVCEFRHNIDDQRLSLPDTDAFPHAATAPSVLGDHLKAGASLV